MADNYLEKKMDDYRRGQSGRVNRSASRASVRGGYPPLAVLVGCDDAHLQIAEATVKRLKLLGCKVSLWGCSSAAGSGVAQRHGATFYPEGIADVFQRDSRLRGRVDAVVDLGAAVPCHDDARVVGAADLPSGLSDDAAALVISFLLHPLARGLKVTEK